VKIIHFSDAHAGGPAEDWRAYIDKRWVGVFNYCFRRRFQHDLTLLQQTVEYIIEVKPDLAVCTGDITSTGQPGEFQKSLKILAPLVENTDIPFLFIPGNHDYYVYNQKCVAAMKEAVDYLNRGQLAFDDLPVKRQIGELEFLIVNESWPSNLLASWGFMRKADADQISQWCREEKSIPRVLVGHYPILERHPLLRIRHRVWGQEEVTELLQSGIIDLSLCGHRHRPYALLDERGRGEICAGSITRNNSVATIDFDSEKDIFHYEKFVFKNLHQ